MPVIARPRGHHLGHVGRDRADADGAGRGGRRGADPVAHLSSIYGGAREDRRARRVLPQRPATTGWLPDLDHVSSLITPATRALVVIDPNNPTGATLSRRHPARPDRDRRRAQRPAARRRGVWRSRVRRPVPPMASLYPDAPIISFSSLSKAYLAPGWRAGWMAVGRTDRLDDVLAGGEEAGGRPALLDRADGIRDRRRAERRSLARSRASARRCASART